MFDVVVDMLGIAVDVVDEEVEGEETGGGVGFGFPAPHAARPAAETATSTGLARHSATLQLRGRLVSKAGLSGQRDRNRRHQIGGGRVASGCVHVEHGAAGVTR